MYFIFSSLWIIIPPEKKRKALIEMKIKRAIALILAAVLALSLASCKAANIAQNRKDPVKENNKDDNNDKQPNGSDPGEDQKDPSGQQDPSGSDEPSGPSQTTTPQDKNPGEYVYTYKEWDESELRDWSGAVDHLFFHQIIAYPELAFDGDSQEKGFDDWMVTVNEFNKILDSLYEKGYILVNMNDVWSEVTDENGVAKMVRNTIKVPKGKKPLIVSIDDTCYYTSYLNNGFMEKLIIGDDGQIWAYGHDPQGNEVTTQDLDIIPLIDKFVREHPDFSYNGAKACLCLTGYEGIFGYRTNTDTRSWTEEQEANRLKEVEAVKPIVEQLRKTGWYFGCHSWGHINLSTHGLKSVQGDMGRWLNEVGSIVGPTKLYFYPHGARPDGDDWHNTGEVFKYLQSQGFRVFASVGVNSFSYIKKDICAVICDRLHPDGTTLRHGRKTYLPFFDAKEVFDYDYRPDYGYDFS